MNSAYGDLDPESAISPGRLDVGDCGLTTGTAGHAGHAGLSTPVDSTASRAADHKHEDKGLYSL